MKKTLYIFAAAVVAALFSMTGCENEKVSELELSISPATATVAPGGSIQLTASGGFDYTWDVPKNGQLSRYNGETVTYIANQTALIQQERANGTVTTYIVPYVVETITVHAASNTVANATITIQQR